MCHTVEFTTELIGGIARRRGNRFIQPKSLSDSQFVPCQDHGYMILKSNTSSENIFSKYKCTYMNGDGKYILYLEH